MARTAEARRQLSSKRAAAAEAASLESWPRETQVTNPLMAIVVGHDGHGHLDAGHQADHGAQRPPEGGPTVDEPGAEPGHHRPSSLVDRPEGGDGCDRSRASMVTPGPVALIPERLARRSRLAFPQTHVERIGGPP